MNKFSKFQATVIPELHPLFKGFLWAASARSTDETRYVLNMVNVEREGLDCHIVATDGRRIHVHTYDPGMFDDDIDMLEPGLYEVIAKTAKLLVICPADETLNYPNWRAIIPDYEPEHEDAMQRVTVGKMGVVTGVLLATDFASDAIGFGHGRSRDDTVLVKYGSGCKTGVFSIEHDLGRAYVMPVRYGEDMDNPEPKTEAESTPDLPGVSDLVASIERTLTSAGIDVEKAKKAGQGLALSGPQKAAAKFIETTKKGLKKGENVTISVGCKSATIHGNSKP